MKKTLLTLLAFCSIGLMQMNAQITLPYAENFDGATIGTYSTNQATIPGLVGWEYTTSTAQGRLRTSAGAGFINSGANAMTMDANVNGANPDPINYLIGHLDMSNFSVATNGVLLSFAYMHHGEESDVNDRAWIRGNNTDPWVEIHNFVAPVGPVGVYQFVVDFNLSAALNGAGQNFSATTELRFGQQDNFSAASPTASDGLTIDDVSMRELPAEDAGIVAVTPTLPFVAGLQVVNATIENFGGSPLTTATIEWTVDGVPQPNFAWTGSLLSGGADVAAIGSFTFPSGTSVLKAWATLPNGMVDPLATNDTTETSFCTGLAGTYTLGGVGADFASFTDLSNDLNACGIGAPVVINVAPGTYADRLILDHVTGTSMANTLTIDGGSAALVTLSNTTFSNVFLDGTDWTTIKNMTLENLGTTDSYGVQLRDSAMNNTIDSCIINLNTTATNLQDVTGVLASSSETFDTGEGQLAFWTTVSNNQINGGEQGIHFEGQFNNGNIGNSFINNTMDLCEDIGIFVDDQDSLTITGNTITNLRNGFADGISLNDIMMFDVSYNTVVNAPDWGFFIGDGNFDAVPTSRGRISNNMILSTADFAMYLDDIEETDIWHNTVANTSTGSGAFRINDMTDVNIRNNVFHSTGDFAFESDDPITNNIGNVVDFNNYWSNGPNLIDDGFTVSADLVAWQTSQPTANISSVEVDPVFVSATDLHVLSPLMDDLGDNTVGILDDIDGDARPAGVNVDMGADEFTSPPVDAGIVSINNLINPITAGVQNINATIRNFGAMNLTAATIAWSANGIAQSGYPWSGSLAPLALDSQNIGTYNFAAGLTTIKVWSTSPNATVDPINTNDTTEMLFCTPLVGTYTLGGVGADFTTFTELGDVLSECGLGGAVIVDVAPGAYTGRLILDHVPGTSMANTLTINGGDASLVTLSNTTFSNVYLNGTRWTTIKNMTLENLGTTDAYGVQLRDSANNNTIDSCIINMDITSTGFDIVGVSASNTEASSFSEGQNAHWTTVSNCQFNGGEKGIHFEGQAFNRNEGNTFTNNTFDLQDDYGFYFDEQDSLTITGNTITNLRNANAEGIACFDIMMFDISYNEIVNVPDWGLYIADGNFDAVPTSRGRIVNNIISATADYGVYLDDIEETDIWHNTIANASTVSGAMRINDMNDVDIRNNIFYSTGDFAFESDDPITTNGNTVDFNSYWSDGPNLIDDGFTLSADLVAWQTSQPTANISSIEADPIFVSATDYRTLSPMVNDLGDNTVGILDDIDGEVRPAVGSVNVDMGADEFTPLNFDAQFEAFTAPGNDCGAVLTEVKVAIRSLGALPLTTMNVNVDVSGDATVSLPFAYTGSLSFGQRDTITVGTFDSYFGLNYNLDGYVALAGDQNTTNDSSSTSVTITPFEPRGIDGYACDGADTAFISALTLPGAAYFWYDAAVGGTQVGSGNSYLVPSVSTQDTYYAEYANNSDSLETAYAGGNGCNNGNMFDVTGINTVTINGVSVNSNAVAGATTAVTIYYIGMPGTNSTYVGNNAAPGAWTTVGTFNVVSAGQNVPTFVDFAGAGFTIGAGDTYAMYVEYDADYTNGAGTYTNADLSITTGMGHCSPFSAGIAGREFNGTLHYGTTACSAIRTPVTAILDNSATAAFTFTQTGLTVDFDATATTDADSVLWNFDDGNSSTSLTPQNIYAANGTYNVCLYAYSNCGIDTLCQTVSITVGVEELNATAGVEVFPNPSKGEFVLDLANYNQEDLNVIVFNQLGKVIFNKTYSNSDNGTQQAIDLSAYSNGVYFLKLTSDADVTTKKIIIQK